MSESAVIEPRLNSRGRGDDSHSGLTAMVPSSQAAARKISF